MNLTDEEIRIKVAKACGWTHVQPIRYHGIKIIGVPPNAWESDLNFPTSDPDIWCALVPNYPEDLNAAHEMEETLSEEERPDYVNNLYIIALEHQRLTGKWRYSSLSARQRCLAYLKTKGVLP